jgi:hypothetical protein
VPFILAEAWFILFETPFKTGQKESPIGEQGQSQDASVVTDVNLISEDDIIKSSGLTIIDSLGFHHRISVTVQKVDKI